MWATPNPRVMNTTGQMGVAVGCGGALSTARAWGRRHWRPIPRASRNCTSVHRRSLPGPSGCPAQARWTIIDDADAERVTFHGEWKKGLHENGDHVGSGFRYAEQGSADTWAAYALPVRQTGMYRIRMIWNYYWNGRAGAVPVTIRHAHGTLRDRGHAAGLGPVARIGDRGATPGKVQPKSALRPTVQTAWWSRMPWQSKGSVMHDEARG